MHEGSVTPAQLRAGRALLGLSQAELAERASVTVEVAVLHGSAGWCLDLDDIGRLFPPDLGFRPCRSRPMLLAVTASPSSGTG